MPFGFKKDKSSKSPAPQANPYAVPAAGNDPYAAKPADPYSSKASYPPPYASNGSSSQLRQDKSPVPVGGYGGAPPPNRYGGSNNYGQSGGYGSNPYGGAPAEQSQPQSRYGPGGYGGLGRSNSQDTMSTDAGRAALFGDAPTRQRPSGPPQQSGMPPPSGTSGQDQSYSNGYGDSSFAGGYGGYPDRELTAEEQEEEDVQATKNEIRFIKQQDVASTRNARRIAEQAEATGRETLARLGEQGDRIHNAERNLDMASTQNRIAQEKAAELKTLNRSMFAMHVANPFTKAKREQQANDYALAKHREDRNMMDATRKEAQSTANRRDAFGRQFAQDGRSGPQDKKSLAERSKYQFEADSEDDEMENEIEENLDVIHRGAKTLNQLGRAMGNELDEQNKHIHRITEKTDRVGDGIAVNSARLNRIGK